MPMWVDDVRQMNKFLYAEVPDVAGHLFGRERIAMTPVRAAFTKAFGPHCFYCRVHLPAGNPVDHVLAWSLVGIDGLANLVLACAKCNDDKSGALPAIEIVDRVLDPDRDVLEEIASEIQWPTQRDRVVAAARGIFRGQPEGLPTWGGVPPDRSLRCGLRAGVDARGLRVSSADQGSLARSNSCCSRGRRRWVSRSSAMKASTSAACSVPAASRRILASRRAADR